LSSRIFQQINFKIESEITIKTKAVPIALYSVVFVMMVFMVVSSMVVYVGDAHHTWLLSNVIMMITFVKQK